MTVFSNKNIAHAIFLASKEKNHEEQTVFSKKVVLFLAKRRLLSKTKDILAHLSKIMNDHDGRIVAKVSSSEKINPKTHQDVTQALLKRYSAKEVALVETIDKKLIGGLKIEVNDEVIDLSIRNKMEKLQAHLTRNI